MKKILMTIAVLALLIVAGCTSVITSQVARDNTLKIGFIGPLSGDAAAYGLPLQQVVDVAVAEINAQGGVNGMQLEIIYEDGGCDASGATSAAQKLISIDGVKLILGGLCSGETLGAAPVAEQNQVILFSAGSGSPDITQAGEFVFRNFPSDATSASKVARAAVLRRDTNIAIISEQTDYAQAAKRVFKQTFLAEGGKVVRDESFASDATDFRTQLTKIKSANPDGIYVAAQTPATFGLVLKQMRELGIEQQLYTNEFAAAEDILNQYGDEVEGAIFAEPDFDENSQKARVLLNKLRSKYGELSGALPPVYFATQYDAVYILKEAIEACGGTNTQCIKSQLYGIQNRLGTAGLLSIDSNGDAQFEYVLKRVRDGEVREV